MNRVAIGFVLLWLGAPALAAGVCDEVTAKADAGKGAIRPPWELRVKAPERLYFHTAPDASCRSKVFVIHGDVLTGHERWNGWLSVLFVNARTGKDYSGWVPEDQVEVLGALGGETAAVPEDAKALAERLASCTHFGGEFNGDGSEHDREVNKLMTELKCGAVEADVEAMRKKYGGNRAVQEALDAAAEP